MNFTQILLTGFSTLVLLASIVLAVPIFVLLCESFVAALALRISSAPPLCALEKDIKLAVLIPAHNEEQGIAAVIEGVKQHLRSQDRLLVVADNCTDGTATVAETMGASVIERSNAEERGKGYALDFGLKALSSDPPDVVVFMDADCRVASGSLLSLANAALSSDKPTQAIYLFKTPDSPTSKTLISAFAIKVKNWVRPLGLFHLGLPTLLFGTGMAFPWKIISSAELANAHIVEDMKLGFDLAIAGHSPQFYPAVTVEGELPQANSASTSQRTRWEHGHLKILQAYLPSLLWQTLRQRRTDLAGLCLELSVPPLSLLVLLWFGVLLLAIVVGLIGIGWQPVIIVVVSGAALASAIGISWYSFAKDDLRLSQLLSVVRYVFWKIPLYLKFIIKPQADWVRTDRSTNQKSTSD